MLYRRWVVIDARTMAARVGRVWLGVVLGSTVVGCGDDGVTEDDGGMEALDDDGDDDDDGPSGADDPGPADGPDDDSDSAGSSGPAVPDNDYCAGVAQWSESEIRFESEVLELVNERRAAGASCGGQAFGAAEPLAMESALLCAARVHSLDMAERGFFGHDNPDGEGPFDRMRRAGYRFSAAGENIAAGQSTPQMVVQGWMDSAGHCRNIMNADYTELGVGYVQTDTAEFSHYWTQVFGEPF